MPRPQLSVVPQGGATPATAVEFAEAVRSVVGISRKGGLVPPVFRSPPRRDGVDRTIRHRGARSAVVAVRRAGRPLSAVRSDVIEGVVVANGLTGERADRFRHAAWAAIEGRRTPPRSRDVPPSGNARVA